ncbi:hypothetical protein OJAV_G00128680 [Oryzias javanicus]|uniref:Uncharacterized protein n=1 Tax=Oryzias javanicus TaxID=123683 RepID=A0A437CRZ6_ORYJA|nr:hypothetical protein OJAV_G00128680 [Oryzias javanicus]
MLFCSGAEPTATAFMIGPKFPTSSNPRAPPRAVCILSTNQSPERCRGRRKAPLLFTVSSHFQPSVNKQQQHLQTGNRTQQRWRTGPNLPKEAPLTTRTVPPHISGSNWTPQRGPAVPGHYNLARLRPTKANFQRAV